MPGTSLSYRVKDLGVKKMLHGMKERTGRMRPAFEVIGETIRTSVVKNFETGGRPKKWPESQRALGKGGKTLIDTSRLLGSIKHKASDDRVEVGTNVPYAAVHQFGVAKFVMVRRHVRKVKSRDVKEGRKTIAKGVTTVRPHKRFQKAPKRKYLVVQNEDRKEIVTAMAKHITGGGK